MLPKVIFMTEMKIEDNQEMPQLRSTALPRHQRKESAGTNKDTTNATYEITNANKEEPQQRNHLRKVSRKITGWGC